MYLYDHDDGSLTLASVSSQGAQGNGPSNGAVISAGNYVAFASTASNLVANDTNGVSDIFLHSRLSNTTERVSISTDGSQSTGPSDWPVINDDGGTIGFVSAGGASLDPTPDPIACSVNVCFRPYIRAHRIMSGPEGTHRVPFVYEGETAGVIPFGQIVMSDQGTTVAAVVRESRPRMLVRDQSQGQTQVVEGGGRDRPELCRTPAGELRW